MLLALLTRRLTMPKAAIPATNASTPRRYPHEPIDILNEIASTISVHGRGALSAPQNMIWNTAVVISFMTGDRAIVLPDDARVHSWSAARDGFREMGLPELAEFVKSLVIELAFRTELDAKDRRAASASLLRIAELKQRFQTIAATIDFAAELNRLIVRYHSEPPTRM